MSGVRCQVAEDRRQKTEDGAAVGQYVSTSRRCGERNAIPVFACFCGFLGQKTLRVPRFVVKKRTRQRRVPTTWMSAGKAQSGQRGAIALPESLRIGAHWRSFGAVLTSRIQSEEHVAVADG